MQKTLFRLLSLFLTLVLLMNMLPMSIFAAELQANTNQAEKPIQSITSAKPHVVQEIPEKRTEYSKEFLLSNGLHMATIYPEAVHYEKDGVWADIDNTIKAHADGTYRNTAGVWEVSFPNQLTRDNSVSVTKDGYTLSFTMAGELTGNALSKSTETLSLGKVTPSSAQVQELSTRKVELTHPETVQDKLHSRLLYSKVYTDTHVQYDLTSNKVKESIILESYRSDLRGYRYTLQVGDMIPVLEESGQLLFYDTEQKNVVMVMPAPYLVDSNDQYNTNIQVQLTGEGSAYTLTYLLPNEWLAEEDRAWPVILDPVVWADMNINNIRDMTVASGRVYPNNSVLDAGYYNGNDKITRFYLKYDNLPAITSSDVILHAEVRLRKMENSDNSAPVEVHKVTGTWDSSTITWSNKPAHNTTVEDVVIVQNASYYTWEITDIAQGWYSGANTGMMFKTPDSIETGGVNNYKQFYSSDYTTNPNYQPLLTFYFRNNNGLEGYWDYTSASAGRAGTGYVNNFTGNLTWVREDLGFGGNRAPVSIQHVYNLNDSDRISDSNNSNDTAGNYFGLGNGWRTNYHQRVYQWSENSAYYVWEDSDGTDHYFEYSSTNTYVNEQDKTLILTVGSNGTEKYTITDKNDNKWFFDTYGRLTKLQNNQATKSSITITYTTNTGPYISAVTDGAGRKYNFHYTDTNVLESIRYTGTGTTEITRVSYGYDSLINLTRITDQDGKHSIYTYTGKLLTTATDPGGYKLTYTYNTPAHTWQPYRVKSIAEADGTTAGSSLTLSYAHNQTTFTDHKGDVEIHQFNDFGNTVSIQDDEGRAQFSKFAFNTDDEKTANTDATKKSNQLRLSSKLQNSVGNILKDSNFEGNTPWTANHTSITAAVTANEAYRGSRSLKVTATGNGSTRGAYSHYFYVAPGETITFSAYVKSTDAVSQVVLHYRHPTTGQYISIPSTTVQPTGQWVREEVTYTNTVGSGLTMYAYLFVPEPGTVYMDCTQAERANSASRYNMVENGDFAHSSTNSVAYGWNNGGHIESTETRQTTTSAAVQLDGWAYRVTGGASRQKHLYQYITQNGNKGDAYVFSGWGKGNSIPLGDHSGQNREFAICATFCNTDGTQTSFTASFNPDVENWQYTAGGMIAEKAYSRILIELKYNFNANTVYFDGIQLYKEEFGNTYTYDEDGNVTTVRDLQGQKTQYEYENNDLTKEILPSGAELEYEYDDYHNVTKATTEEDLVYNFTYDAYGNNTKVSVGSGAGAMSTSATYSTDGNRLVSTTDALGNTTTYSYNAQTNVLDWVKYPENTDATKTTYSYDVMYRMAAAAATTDTGLNMSAGYTYTDDLLTQLTTPSTTYSFTYGVFDQRTAVKIGSRTLASYTYTDNKDRYLSRLDYGNGDNIQYTYDDKGRVTCQTYEDGAYISYTYDNSGILTKQYDSATGRTTAYTYDTTGRMMKYTVTGTGYTHSVSYEYDENNNLKTLTETTNGTTTTTSYTYDDDTRVTSVTSGGVTKYYTYDALGRVTKQETKNDTTPIMEETISYVAGTNQVQEKQYFTPSEIYQQFFYYTYDDNGNIVSVQDEAYETRYSYDSANQLTREDNEAVEFTKTWSYDDSGNIFYRDEYDLTYGTLGDPNEVYEFWYDEENGWGDLLLSCNPHMGSPGANYSSDAIGNMTGDGTWTYSWKHGRQLSSMSDGSITWTYSYDANGMRTQRTNGTDTYTYTYNGSQLTQMTKGEHTLNFTYDANGTPMTVTWDGTVYYYATNLQGDVMDILDADGEIVASYRYDAWGLLCSSYGDLAELNPLRYRGYVYDQETKLYYLQSRYYDPELGRFINADSLIDNRGIITQNLFQYCGNNPVNNADPSGNLFGAIVGIGLLVIGMVATLSGCSSKPAATTSTTSAPSKPSTPSSSTSSTTPPHIPTPQEKSYAATVYAEAGGQNKRSKQAVAHVMNNRIGTRSSWTDIESVISAKYQFDGYNSPMYQAAMNYYNNGICNNSIEQAAMDECLAVVIPIYSGAEADITGGALYFHSFPNPSDWAYHNSYTQVYVSGTEKFWFYK